MLTNPPVPFDFCDADPISRGPSRGLLRDCTTGCGTDGSFYSTTKDGIFHEHVAIALPKHSPWTARFNHEIKMMLQSGLAMAWKKVYLHCKLGKYLCLFLYLEILAPCEWVQYPIRGKIHHDRHCDSVRHAGDNMPQISTDTILRYLIFYLFVSFTCLRIVLTFKISILFAIREHFTFCSAVSCSPHSGC